MEDEYLDPFSMHGPVHTTTEVILSSWLSYHSVSYNSDFEEPLKLKFLNLGEEIMRFLILWTLLNVSLRSKEAGQLMLFL